MHRNYEFLVKILTSAFDSLTLISSYSTIFRQFEDVFCWFFLHWISWMSAIFLIPVWLTYWPRKCVMCLKSLMKVSTKVEVGWHDHPLPTYSFIAADTLCDHVTLTFDILVTGSHASSSSPLAGSTDLSLLIHGGSRGQPLHQVWRSYGCLLLSYEFWHLPLTMRLEPLRMHRITSSMHRGKFFPHIWNPRPRFAYCY